jgi:hypothetical protein
MEETTKNRKKDSYENGRVQRKQYKKQEIVVILVMSSYWEIHMN